ncbi:hypothetical protein Lal_00041107 [Lupinus albus]|nr:hypothetical protein Lal_00041107 [Lupinus albus]
MSAGTAADKHFSNSFFAAPLTEADPEIARAVEQELGRQQHEIELIASENIVSRAVLEAQGSVLTNKYAEGYPGRRYYGGCQFVDIAEDLAIDRAKRLFDCGFRQRAAELGQPGQPGRVPCPHAAGRHLPRPRSRGRWPPDARRPAERLRQVVQAGLLHRAPGGPAHRHGAGRPARAGAQAEGDHRRRLGLPAPLGFRQVP